MQLFVKDFCGKTRMLDVYPAETIRDIKDRLYYKEGRPRGYGMLFERLVYNGKELEDDKTLLQYGIHQTTTVYALMRIKIGGPMVVTIG